MSSVRIPKKLCEDQFRLVEPQINAEKTEATKALSSCGRRQILEGVT